jgi:hypothetical protein
MRRGLLIAILCALPVTLGAQATRIISGGTLPSNCTVGNIFVKTGDDAGFYSCAVTDTWEGPYVTGLEAPGAPQPPDDEGTSGETEEIDFSTGSRWRTVTLDDDTAFTLSGLTSGFSYTIFFNTGDGSFTPTFTNTILWEGGTAHSFTQDAGAIDVCVFVYAGTSLYATCGGDFVAP